ncbi:MAG: hypothetical protein WCK98_05970 [bacterium]
MNFFKNRSTIPLVTVTIIAAILGFYIFDFLNLYLNNQCKKANAQIALNTKIVSKSNPNFYLVAESSDSIKKDYAYAAKQYNYDKCEAYTDAKLNFYYELNNQTQLIYSSKYSLSQQLENRKNLNFNLTKVLEKLIESLVVKTSDKNSNTRELYEIFKTAQANSDYIVSYDDGELRGWTKTVF